MSDTLRILGPSGRMSRRQFLTAAGGALALGLAGCTSGGRTLNFYNWSLFIGPDTIPGFETQTGIRVNYDEFSSADVMYAKIKIGVTGYDLVVSPEYMLRRMIRQKLVRPLPRRPQASALLAKLQRPPWDPDLEYSLPYLWGSTGIAYNRSKCEGTPDSWDLLWDERLARRITMLDEKRDSIGAALIRLGFNGNSVDPEELKQARESLLAQRPLVRRYTSDFTDDLIRGETWASLAWSGDVHQAREGNPDVAYYVPRQGGFFFVDNLCMPHQAPHPEEAMQFIEFYMHPEVAAGVTNATGYANPIAASLPLIDKKLIGDPLTYPSPEIMDRLIFQEDLGAGERLWDKIWEEVKR